MAGKVLIVDIHAELYRDRLVAEFPGLQFMLFHKAAEVSADLSAIDIMIMFGIEIRDHMLRDAPRLQWIQSLATGVDHFLRCPSLRKDVLITSGRGIHGVPMREHVLYLMLAISHDAKRQVEDHQQNVWQRRLWSTLHGKTAVIAGTGVVGAAFDVFATEPLPPESPFWTLPNVFITPHVGGYVVEYEDFIMPLIVDNMRLFLAGRLDEMANIVTR